jgi:hypothetical protein
MSYLDPPRFSFSGQFFTNPSTINNSTPNYDAGAQYNTSPPSSTNVNSVSWNPAGWAFFQLQSATVNGACAQLGTPITSGDPIIGASLISVVASSSPPPPPPQQGRLVDLDPDQQNCSMIVGLQLQLSIGDVVVFTGTMAPATIIDLWGRVQSGSAQGINTAGCMYQSVIQNVSWPGLGSVSSPLLNALHSASPDTLSIKFNADAYNGIPQAAEFNTGRIVGTVGPYGSLTYGAPEPLHVLAQRRMYGGAASVDNTGTTQLNPAPFQTKNGYLSIDLGNSIPTTSTPGGLAGDFLDLGPVCPVVGSSVLAPLFTTSDEYAANYTTFAGIFDVALGGVSAANVVSGLQMGPSGTPGNAMTPLEASAAKKGESVAVTTTALATAGAVIALAENSGGQFASFDFNALRLAQDAVPWSDSAMTGTEITSTAEVPFYATVFGGPAANQTFNVQTAFDPNGSANTPAYVGNAPASAVTPAPTSVNPPATGPTPDIATITTDANGRGAFSVTANGLSSAGLDSATDGWRTGLGSQVYLYTHDWNMNTLASPATPGGQPLTFLVFVNAAVQPSPTWTSDIQPIFDQYAKIYPGMKQVLDLSDYNTVVANLGVFKTVMNLPMSDPRCMPVTRDLSPTNLAMINAWFANPLP